MKAFPIFFLSALMMILDLCHVSWAFFHTAVDGPRCRDIPRLQQTIKTAAAGGGGVVYPDPPLPNFCSNCGSACMEIRVPPDDERPRACCADCGHVVYVNPKIVVATVVLSPRKDGGVSECLLAKRAIEPRKGYWGIPQGFMELGETTRQAAVREVYEETGAVLHADQLTFRAVYNVPGSVQLVYEAVVPREALAIAASTVESTQVGFFALDALPDLCFPTVQWALDHCISQNARGSSGGGRIIQQKTKFYDATKDVWGEYEDEVAA